MCEQWTPALQALLVWLLSRRGAPATAGAPAWRYVAVLDCGSSGSRASVFRVEDAADGALPRLSLLPPSAAPRVVPRRPPGMLVHRVETRPGVAAAYLEDTRFGVRARLRPLLAWAEAAVPPGDHHATALLLCATAGVRSLPPTHRRVRFSVVLLLLRPCCEHRSRMRRARAADVYGARVQLLLVKARNLLRRSAFVFRDEWATDISGPWEAALGWLALNHQLARLPGSPPLMAAGARSREPARSLLASPYAPEDPGAWRPLSLADGVASSGACASDIAPALNKRNRMSSPRRVGDSGGYTWLSRRLADAERATVAVLDLGGSSLEIAMAAPPSSPSALAQATPPLFPPVDTSPWRSLRPEAPARAQGAALHSSGETLRFTLAGAIPALGRAQRSRRREGQQLLTRRVRAGRRLEVVTASQAHVGLADAFTRSLSLLALQGTSRAAKPPERTGKSHAPPHKPARPKRALRNGRPSTRQDRGLVAATKQPAGTPQHRVHGGESNEEAPSEMGPTLYHPCLPVGYRERHEGVRVVAPDGSSAAREVTVRGGAGGEAADAACEAHVRAVLSLPELTCPAGASCGAPQRPRRLSRTRAGILLARPHARWRAGFEHLPSVRGSDVVALAAFHVVAAHFRLAAANATVDAVRVATAAECAAPAAALRGRYAGELQALHYCFRGHLVLQLLRLLGARDDRVAFGGGDATWSMGAALYFLAAQPDAAAPGAQPPPRLALSRFTCTAANRERRSCFFAGSAGALGAAPWAAAAVLVGAGLLLGLLLARLCPAACLPLPEASRRIVLQPLQALAAVATLSREPSRAWLAGAAPAREAAQAPSPRQQAPRLPYRQSFGGLQHKRTLSRNSLLSDV